VQVAKAEGSCLEVRTLTFEIPEPLPAPEGEFKRRPTGSLLNSGQTLKRNTGFVIVSDTTKILTIDRGRGRNGGLPVAGDGTILEANRPQLVSLEVTLPRLDESWDGFRIAQLSDLHYDEYFSVVPLLKAIDIVNRLKPDLVVLTGDCGHIAAAKRGSYCGGSADRTVR
jgi:hypothetical protein